MKNQLTSQRLQVNAGIMAWYVKELTKMTQAMTKECKEELAKIYKKGYPQIAFGYFVFKLNFYFPLLAFSLSQVSIEAAVSISIAPMIEIMSDKFILMGFQKIIPVF